MKKNEKEEKRIFLNPPIIFPNNPTFFHLQHLIISFKKFDINSTTFDNQLKNLLFCSITFDFPIPPSSNQKRRKWNKKEYKGIK